MGALGNMLKGLREKWVGLSRARKAGIVVLAVGIAFAVLFFIVYTGRTKYEPLFLNMQQEDMAKVVEKLKQDKVEYKLDGNTILVPEDMVEDLRLSVVSAGIMPSNGKGFELFDETRFGMTDTETRILYQRALETELQRTIMAFDEIEYARVHLVLPESSAFVRDEKPARASVTLKLKSARELSPEQVKAIVAMVSGSVKNLPKENVEVVDSNFNLLSEKLFNEDYGSPESIKDRYEVEKKFEASMVDNIKEVLEPVFGQGRVKVTVNADLDFDSKEITELTYDPNSIIKSQNEIIENMTDTSPAGGSPIDNQMGNVIVGEGTVTSSRKESSIEYNVGHKEVRTIVAPGYVNKMSVSVVIDRNLAEDVKETVMNIVKSAAGYDELRGDLISVEGIPFDNTAELEKQERIEKDLEEMRRQQEEKERKERLFMYIAFGAAGLILFAILIVVIARMRRKAKDSKGNNIDMVIDEPVTVTEAMTPQAVLDEEDERPDLTKELRKYASRKPDEVVDIIKSWLAEDER